MEKNKKKPGLKQGGDSPDQFIGKALKAGIGAVQGFRSGKGQGFGARLKGAFKGAATVAMPGVSQALGIGNPFETEDVASAGAPMVPGYGADPVMQAQLNAMRGNQIGMQQQLAAPTVKKGRIYGGDSPGQFGGSALAKTGCSRKKY